MIDFTTHLSRDNWAIRYGYFGSDYIPSRTNLCKLFWRCVFRTTIYGVVLALLGHLLIYIYVWTDEFVQLLIVLSIILVITAFLIGLWEGGIKGWRYLCDDLIDDKPAFNPIKEYARAVKSKVCPLIIIE